MPSEPHSKNIRVFISYSREDCEFALQLRAGLGARYGTWLDLDKVPVGSRYAEVISRAIEQCQVFLFIVSPDSVASKECALEAETALRHNKRIIPIMLRRVDPKMVPVSHPAKGVFASHWAEWTEQRPFEQWLESLCAAIERDDEHLIMHDRLENRALEWERHEREVPYLISGEDLAQCEDWLLQAGSREPAPTALQRAFVQAAREHERQEQQRWKELFEKSVIGEVEALNALASAHFLSHRGLDALIPSVRAALTVRQADVPASLTIQTGATLNFLLHHVREQNRVPSNCADLAFEPGGRWVACIEQTQLVVRSRIGLERFRAAGPFHAVAVGPSATRIACGGDSGLTVFSAEGVPVENLTTEVGAVTRVRYSPDGRFLAAAGHGISLFDLQGEEVIHRPEKLPITHLAFASGSDLLAWISNRGIDGLVTVVRLKDWSIVGTFEGPTSLAFGPEGAAWVYFGYRDGRITRIGLDQEASRAIAAHQGVVSSLDCDPRTNRMASAGHDGSVRVWTPEGKLVLGLEGHPGTVVQVAFVPGENALASIGTDKMLRFWDLTPREIPTLGRRGCPCAVNRDVSVVVSVTPDRVVRLEDTSGRALESWSAGPALAHSVGFDANGQRLRLAKHDGTIEERGLDGRLFERRSGYKGGVLLPFPDAMERTVVRAPGTGVFVLDRVGEVCDFVECYGFGWSVDGQFIVAGTKEGTVRVLDGHFQEVRRFEGHQAYVLAVSVAADARVFATGGSDHRIQVWNQRGEPLGAMIEDEDVVALAFSPRGDVLAAANLKNQVSLWNLNGKRIAQLPPSPGQIGTFAWSPDERKLIGLGWQGPVFVWNLDLDALIKCACAWAGGFVTASPEVAERLRK